MINEIRKLMKSIPIVVARATPLTLRGLFEDNDLHPYAEAESVALCTAGLRTLRPDWPSWVGPGTRISRRHARSSEEQRDGCNSTAASKTRPRYQGAAPPTKDEQMAVVRIALEGLLHQQGETIEPLAHVGVAARQPYLHAARHLDHRRRPAFARIVIMALTSEGSVGPVIRSREPFANPEEYFSADYGKVCCEVLITA